MVIKEYLNLVKETLRHKHLTQVNLFFFFLQFLFTTLKA